MKTETAETAETASCLELILTWGGNPQHTELYREPGSIVVGETESADFFLPREVVASPFALVTAEDDGWVLTVPAGATAAMERPDSTGALEQVDLQSLGADPTGARRARLPHGAHATVELGAFTFHLRVGDAPEQLALGTRLDWRAMRWIAGSAAFHLALVIPFLFSPPDAGALSFDVNDRQREYIEVHMDAFQQPEPVVDDRHLADATTGAAATNEGQPMDGEEGASGDPNEQRNTGGGVSVPGPDRVRRVPLTAQDVESMGTIGALARLASHLPISSEFGSERANGWSAEAFWGPLMAASDGFGPGTRGFGMIGTGRGACPEGATNCDAGTVGVGDLDTIGRTGGCSRADFERLASRLGRGAATDRCSGTARNVTLDDGDREGGVPTVRPAGEAEIIGGLSREQIRRVVRRNIGQVRHCYEQGLITRPDIEGRVQVAFVISPTGAVTSSDVATSALNDGRVETCVANAFRRFPFPRSPGVTAVTYPVVFNTPN